MSHITDPDEPYFKDGIWGWDGAVWRKLPLVWGYSSVYHETGTIANAAAGINEIPLTAVAAGEVWVIHGVWAVDATSNISKIQIYIGTPGTGCAVSDKDPTAAGDSHTWNGTAPIINPQHVKIRFEGCIVNDSLYVYAWGYKMSITE